MIEFILILLVGALGLSAIALACDFPRPGDKEWLDRNRKDQK